MATEKSLSIVVKARDEASAKMRQMQNNIRQGVTSAIAPFVAVGAAISMASKAAAAGVMMHMATARRAAAMQSESVTDILESQIEINTAWSELGGSIPVIGESVKKAMDAWNDVQGIRNAIQQVKALETATQKYHQMNIKSIRDTEIIRAQIADKSASEIERIRNRHRKEDNARTLEAMDAEIAAAREKLDEIAAMNRKAQHKRVLMAEGTIGKKSSRQAAEAAEMAERKATEQILDLIGKRAKLAESMDQNQAANAAKTAAAGLAEREQLSVRIRALLDTDLQASLRAKAKEFDEVIALARAEGRQVVDLERRKQEVLQGIREDYARREQQERDRQARAAADKARREAEALARDESAVQRIIFDATHDRREQDLRDLDQWFAEMREKHAGNAALLAKLHQAEAIRRGQIEMEALRRRQQAQAAERDPGAGRDQREVAAFTSRFLTRAPGQQDPPWVSRMTDKAAEQIAILERMKDDLPREIGDAVAKHFRQWN